MSVFTSAQGSLNEAVATLSKNKMTRTAVSGVEATLTAAQFINGIYHNTATDSDSYDLTTPDAADIVDAIKGCEVGTSFEFIVQNDDETALAAITVLAGTGVTIYGTETIDLGKNRRFVAVVTNVGTPAVALYARAQLA